MRLVVGLLGAALGMACAAGTVVTAAEFTPLSYQPAVTSSAADTTPTVPATDVLYLIDVSGSVIGLGRSDGDVLSQLITALNEEIYLTTPGTTVSVATFADGLFDVDGPGSEPYQAISTHVIGADRPAPARDALVSYINGLDQAVRAEGGHGDRTALYDAIASALDYLDSQRATWNDHHPGDAYEASHIQKLVVITDGTDNASSITKDELIEEITSRQRDGPMRERLFVKVITAAGVDIDLGPVPVETWEFDTRRIEVLCVPSRLDIGRLDETTRTITGSVRLVAQRPMPGTAIDWQWHLSGGMDGSLEVRMDPARIRDGATSCDLTVSLEVVDWEALQHAATVAGQTSFVGTLSLTAAHPGVDILPSLLNVTFSLGGEGVVTIRPALNNEGVLRMDPTARGPTGPLTYYLDFNRWATASKLVLRAEFRWAPGNPDDIAEVARRSGTDHPGLIRLTPWRAGAADSDSGGGVVFMDHQVSRLDVAVTIPEAVTEVLKAGRYRGQLIVTPLAAARVVGPGDLAYDELAAGLAPGALAVPVELHVPHPPLPWPVKLGVGLGSVALITLVYVLTRPRFSADACLIVTGPDGRRETIELTDARSHGRLEWLRPAYVTLGTDRDDIFLGADQRVGALAAARRSRAVLAAASGRGGRRLRVGGRAIAGRAWLKGGEIIEYGGYAIECHWSSPARSSRAQVGARKLSGGDQVER